MPEITAKNIIHLDTEPELQHAIQAWMDVARGMGHFDSHCDEVLSCTLAQIAAVVNWTIYEKKPELFNAPPPPHPGCQCGIHDIEQTLLKGEFDDIPTR